jgi:hypothetical protein
LEKQASVRRNLRSGKNDCLVAKQFLTQSTVMQNNQREFSTRRAAIFTSFIALASLVNAQSDAAKSLPTPAGDYYLQGVREVGSQIRLSANGKFEYFLSYGSEDQSVSGRWRKEGKFIVLEAAPLPEPSFTTVKLSPELDRIDDKDAPPDMAMVKIVSSQLGLTWSNMVITAEFANGKIRSGTTGRNGTLLFVKRTEPEWLDLPIVRIAVEYPPAKVAKRWFAMDSKQTKAMLVEFEPGNLSAQAFKTLRLVLNQTTTETSLITDGAKQGNGWRYVKR